MKIWQKLRWPGTASLFVLLLLTLCVIAPQLLSPEHPNTIHPANAFHPPSITHLFGTDESGRDVFARVIHGTTASAGIGLTASGIGISIGTIIGFASAIGPPLLDSALSRIIQVLFAFPTLVSSLLLVSIIGGGPQSATIAIGLATIPGYARILRTHTKSITASGYVEWARIEGVHPVRVFFRHIAPHSLRPLLSAATIGVGQAIIWVSALGFLGLGALPPSPEWGAMLHAGRVYLSTAWWMSLFPGLAIVATAAALTTLGQQFAKKGIEP